MPEKSDDIQDFSRLSPHAVLGTAPLNREELLKAAAEAPDTQLILPELPQRPPLPEPPLAPAITNPVAPATPRVVAVKEVVKPVVPTPDIEVMRPQKIRAKTGKKTSVGLILSLVAAVALLTLIGVSILLATQGVRVPLLYTAITKLQPSGLKERDAALAAVVTQRYYQVASDTYDKTSKVPPHAALSASQYSYIDSSWVDVTSGTTYAHERVTLGKTEIPVLFRSANPARIRFPLVSAPTNQAPSEAEFGSSPLIVLLKPIPLPALLALATSEKGYLSGPSVGGAIVPASDQKVAVYEYAVDPVSLIKLLPVGKSILNPVLTVRYAWGSNLPVTSVLNGEYAAEDGIKNQFSLSASYDKWGSAKPSEFAVLDAGSAEPVSLPDLRAELGATSKTTVLTPPKLSVFTPLVPANTSISALETVITASPPPPATAANPQAVPRDATRKADLALLRSALIGYKTATSGYPISSGLEQVQASKTLFSSLIPVYLTAMPTDPIATVYWYEYQSDGKAFTLRSVAENPSDPEAKLGRAYHYFILTN